MFTRTALLAGMAAALAAGGYSIGLSKASHQTAPETNVPPKVAIADQNPNLAEVSGVAALQTRDAQLHKRVNPPKQPLRLIIPLSPKREHPSSPLMHPFFLRRSLVGPNGLRNETTPPKVKPRLQLVAKAPRSEVTDLATEMVMGANSAAPATAQGGTASGGAQGSQTTAQATSQTSSTESGATSAAFSYTTNESLWQATLPRAPVTVKYFATTPNSAYQLDADAGFLLIVALQHRYELGLTSHQVTRLQLLQAEFITKFAPLREEYENKSGEGRIVSWIVQPTSNAANTIEYLSVIPSNSSTVNQIRKSPPKTSTDKNAEAVQSLATHAADVIQKGDRVQYQVSIETVKPVSYVSLYRATIADQVVYTVSQPPNPKALAIAAKVKLLKADFTARAMKILDDAQRKSLNKLVDQSGTSKSR